MNRKQRDSNRANSVTLGAARLYTPCPNCGQRGPHFVPPSFGQRGFYICEKGPKA